MKRTKSLLSVIVSLLLAFTMAFALVACNPGEEKKPNITQKPDTTDKSAGDLGIDESQAEEDWALQYIDLIQVGKTNFNLGEQFSSDGLSVRAVLINPEKQATIEDIEGNLEYKTLSDNEFVVDSSDYNPNRVGVYTISVSYTHAGVTRSATYSVSVQTLEPAIGGIVAEIAPGATDTYYLTATEPSVVIPKDIVAVYTLKDESGKAVKSAEPLADDKYEAQLYLGSKEVANNEAKENGVYSLVTTLKEDESKQDFIPVYVVNPVTKIELDKTTGVFTQDKGLTDNISGTWQFILTYANGLTKTIKAGTEGLTVEIESNVAGNNKTTTVTYTEAGITVTCEVTYTIKALGGAVTNEYSLNIAELVAALEARTGKTGDDLEKTALEASDFTGSNAFLTLVEGSGSSDQYRKNNGGLIEIKGDRLQVTFEGTGTLTVSFASTGGSNESHFGLKNAAGSYIAAAVTEATLVADGDDAGTYTVTGTSAVAVTYEITEAGTYTLCSPSGVTTRGCRITAISMTDTVSGGEAVTTNYSLSISELVAAIETRTGAAPADKTALAAEDFTGSNAFLAFISEGAASSDQYRTNNGGLIEIKGNRLQVTFEGTGTLTVSFASTGGSNESHFGLKNAAGSYIAAAVTEATLVADGDDAGTYTVTGTSAVAVTYEITEAGTYTLCSPSGVTTRGCRITAISMTDTVGSAGGGSTQPAGEPLVINISDLFNAGTLAVASYKETVVLGFNDYSLISVLATAESDVSVDENKKSIDGYDFTHRLKLSGKGTDAARSIKIELNGAATITVYMMSSSGSADREVGIWTGTTFDPATDAALVATQTVGGSAIEKHEYEITEAGTYYLAAVTGGTNVYGIVITPTV